MEVIGAVAGILQLAQFGTQLSISFYQIAEQISSANKDIRGIAKDIALFSAVLKSLGQTLDRGRTTRVYREDAYRTSQTIVKECGEVFKEIQGLIGDFPSVGPISPARIRKFLWVLRKSRIQLLRGNLESLKSTVSLQLAVLHYADTVATAYSKHHSGVDDLLALRSLVLADKTAKEDVEEIRNTGAGSSDGGATSRMSTTGAGSQLSQIHDNNRPFLPSVHPQPVLGSESGSNPPRKRPMQSSLQTFKPPQYMYLLDFRDRLEFAIERVRISQREHTRIREKAGDVRKDNYLLGKRNSLGNRNPDAMTDPLERSYLQILHNELVTFGLERGVIDRAIASLHAHETHLHSRAEAELLLHQEYDYELIAQLKAYGAVCKIDHEAPALVCFKRWMPSFFEDVLWRHSHRLLLESTEMTDDDHNSGKVVKKRKGNSNLHSFANASLDPSWSQDIHQNKEVKSKITAQPADMIIPTNNSSTQYPSPARRMGIQSTLSNPQRGYAYAPERRTAGGPPRIKACEICQMQGAECDRGKPECGSCIQRKATCRYPKTGQQYDGTNLRNTLQPNFVAPTTFPEAQSCYSPSYPQAQCQSSPSGWNARDSHGLPTPYSQVGLEDSNISAGQASIPPRRYATMMPSQPWYSEFLADEDSSNISTEMSSPATVNYHHWVPPSEQAQYGNPVRRADASVPETMDLRFESFPQQATSSIQRSKQFRQQRKSKETSTFGPELYSSTADSELYSYDPDEVEESVIFAGVQPDETDKVVDELIRRWTFVNNPRATRASYPS